MHVRVWQSTQDSYKQYILNQYNPENTLKRLNMENCKSKETPGIRNSVTLRMLYVWKMYGEAFWPDLRLNILPVPRELQTSSCILIETTVRSSVCESVVTQTFNKYSTTEYCTIIIIITASLKQLFSLIESAHKWEEDFMPLAFVMQKCIYLTTIGRFGCFQMITERSVWGQPGNKNPVSQQKGKLVGFKFHLVRSTVCFHCYIIEVMVADIIPEA